MGNLLSLRNVSKGFTRGAEPFSVLTDVSLDVAEGEIVAVAGSRDCGKTTLLRVAAGIERPDAGEVWFRDQRLVEYRDTQPRKLLGAFNRRLGFSSVGHTHLLGHEIAWTGREGPGTGLKIRDFVGLPLTMGRRRGRGEARGLAVGALERVGASDCAAQTWEELANWQRVLVQLARGIVACPRLLIIDDLLDGLASRRMQEVGRLLHELVGEIDCGVLMSAPDLDAALVADRVWSFTREGLRMMSDQTSVVNAEVIDFPGVTETRRGVGM